MPADTCRIPQALWRAVQRAGIQPPAALRLARLPSTLHLEARRHVSTAQFFALWRAIEELAAEPELGIRLVQETETSLHPPSSLAAFHARDYRDGLLRLARFKRLCTPEVLHLREQQGVCTITTEWLHATEPVPALAADVDFAALVELGRRGSGKWLRPLRIEFARPPATSDIQQRYFDCPLHFNAPRNLLILNAEDLNSPFPGHNPELLEMLTPALAATLRELEAQSSTSDQVKLVLKKSLASGRPELADIARDLGMSDRTLQRRITDEGTTFRDLLVEARKELGRLLLSDPVTEIDEIACLLGYQDTSSFYRAFREWEGVTPNRWRELNSENKTHLSGSAPLH